MALPGPPGDEEYELAQSNWKLCPVAGRTRHQLTPEATKENTRQPAPGIRRTKEAARPAQPPERASQWNLLGRTTTKRDHRQHPRESHSEDTSEDRWE